MASAFTRDYLNGLGWAVGKPKADKSYIALKVLLPLSNDSAWPQSHNPWSPTPALKVLDTTTFGSRVAEPICLFLLARV